MTQARDLADGKFDTDTLVVDAANNRVGVGTASPAATQHTLSGNAAVSIQATTNSTSGYHEYRYNTSTTAGYIGNGSGLLSGANNSDFIVRSEADLVFNGNGNNERGRFLSGGGLTFNGDTAAANALDDYEEGDWTPVITATTTNPTVGYGSQNIGKYTKIGRQVFIFGNIHLSSISGGSGQVKITGLPFSQATGTGFFPAGSVGQMSGFTSRSSNADGQHFIVRANSGASNLVLYESSETGTGGDFRVSDLSSSFFCRFSVVYFV